MVKELKITTTDNPFNPFNEFEDWYKFDWQKGYYTCQKLARLAKDFTDDMTEEEKIIETNRTIERLIEIDPLDIYIKVTQET